MFTSGASCSLNSDDGIWGRQPPSIVLGCSRSYVIPASQQQRSALIGEPFPHLDQRLPHIKLHPIPALFIA